MERYQQIQMIRWIIEEVIDYFDKREDIDNNGNANAEMRLKMDLERSLEILEEL